MRSCGCNEVATDEGALVEGSLNGGIRGMLMVATESTSQPPGYIEGQFTVATEEVFKEVSADRRGAQRGRHRVEAQISGVVGCTATEHYRRWDVGAEERKTSKSSDSRLRPES